MANQTQGGRRKEIVKSTNKLNRRQCTVYYIQTRSWFFEKIQKMCSPLAIPIKAGEFKLSLSGTKRRHIFVFSC